MLEKLEFDKVLDLMAQKCYGRAGAEYCRGIQPSIDHADIIEGLHQVNAYKTGLEQNKRLPISTYELAEEEFEWLAVQDYVLEIESIQKITNTLRVFQSVLMYFTKDRIKEFPSLYAIIQDVPFDHDLVKFIDKILDDEGKVRPNASPTLARIRKKIDAKHLELDRAFRSTAAQFRKQGVLSDSVESVRNGRRVLSVPAEHKRKIRGIIHDESATGKTSYIEPEAVILLNNDLFDLNAAERQEIYRLLKDICNRLRLHIPDIQTYQTLLIRLDVIQAKAALGLEMDGIMPIVKNHPKLGLYQARHPLLYLKNKKANKKTVPFDLALLDKNRILVISGPNAGGKSVTMKAVGLLQLMVQSSMLVPVDKIAEFGIFRKILTDIGDQQSLEDDLSTYSSRLKNMNEFLHEADEHTLLLIDEFGSGTDPKIGGAIAESLLHQFKKLKVTGVLTTHYPNLKIYAFKNKGILNGAMVFDKDKLTPTYQLRIGRPGSSYAFEIAESSGLSPEILKYARRRTGKNERQVDELLIDLQREKVEVEDKLARLKKREAEVDHLVKTYSNLKGDLDFKKRKLKLDAKEKDLQATAKAQRELQLLIKQLKEEKDLEKAKAIAEKIKDERKSIAKEVGELNEEIYQAPETQSEIAKLEVGGHAQFRAGGATGVIESMKGKKATLLIGEMRVQANIADLVAINTPIQQNSRSIKTNLREDNSLFESKLDLRGMPVHDALFTLEKYMDAAIMKDTTTVKILHGKGTGALRRAVRNKLKEYRSMLQNVYHPEEELGGNGITIVDL